MAQAKNYNVALTEETVPNTYEAPTVGGDFVEMADIPTIVTDEEIIERTVVSGSLGRKKTRRGQKIGSAELSLELKSSGSDTAGVTDEARIEQFFEALLGQKTKTGANDTVAGGGSTTTVIDTTLDNYFIGEIVLINNEVRHVKSLPAPNQIELNNALAGAPLDTDVILRGAVMHPDSADNRKYSFTAYEQPTGTAGWLTKLIGSVIANATFNDITNGSLPKVAFTFDSVDWEVDANETNGITPVFEASTPPDNLNVLMQIGGITVESNNITMSVDKATTPQKVVTNDSGILNRVATDRNINGSFDYYPSDTDDSIFDLFEFNTTTDMHFQWGDRDSSGNLIQNTIVSVYLPNVQLNSGGADEEDGFIKRVVAFQAFEEALTDQEIYIGIL